MATEREAWETEAAEAEAAEREAILAVATILDRRGSITGRKVA